MFCRVLLYHWLIILLCLLPPDHLICTQLYSFLLWEAAICQVQTFWILILRHIFVWYNNHYMKGSIVVFTCLNNFAYHLINLGFTLIFIFLHSFDISSWSLSSQRSYLCFIVSFLLWMSHWGLYSLWINIIPWYWVAYASSQIFILRVNCNTIHCSVVTVWKTSQVWHGISSTCT